MSIRPATVKDVLDVSDLSSKVFAAYGDYRYVLADNLLSNRMMTFVYDKENRFAGFIQVSLEPAEQDLTLLSADVVAVAVRPEFQGQGVGTALFSHVFKQLEHLRRQGRVQEVWLTVAHTNEGAIRLFHRLGFDFSGIEAGLYAGGQTALRMVRFLPVPASASG